MRGNSLGLSDHEGSSPHASIAEVIDANVQEHPITKHNQVVVRQIQEMIDEPQIEQNVKEETQLGPPYRCSYTGCHDPSNGYCAICRRRFCGRHCAPSFHGCIPRPGPTPYPPGPHNDLVEPGPQIILNEPSLREHTYSHYLARVIKVARFAHSQDELARRSHCPVVYPEGEPDWEVFSDVPQDMLREYKGEDFIRPADNVMVQNWPFNLRKAAETSDT